MGITTNNPKNDQRPSDQEAGVQEGVILATQSPRFKPWLRRIAAVTAYIFVYTSLLPTGWAQPQTISDETLRALQTLESGDTLNELQGALGAGLEEALTFDATVTPTNGVDIPGATAIELVVPTVPPAADFSADQVVVTPSAELPTSSAADSSIDVLPPVLEDSVETARAPSLVRLDAQEGNGYQLIPGAADNEVTVVAKGQRQASDDEAAALDNYQRDSRVVTDVLNQLTNGQDAEAYDARMLQDIFKSRETAAEFLMGFGLFRDAREPVYGGFFGIELDVVDYKPSAEFDRALDAFMAMQDTIMQWPHQLDRVRESLLDVVQLTYIGRPFPLDLDLEEEVETKWQALQPAIAHLAKAATAEKPQLRFRELLQELEGEFSPESFPIFNALEQHDSPAYGFIQAMADAARQAQEDQATLGAVQLSTMTAWQENADALAHVIFETFHPKLVSRMERLQQRETDFSGEYLPVGWSRETAELVVRLQEQGYNVTFVAPGMHTPFDANESGTSPTEALFVEGGILHVVSLELSQDLDATVALQADGVTADQLYRVVGEVSRNGATTPVPSQVWNALMSDPALAAELTELLEARSNIETEGTVYDPDGLGSLTDFESRWPTLPGFTGFGEHAQRQARWGLAASIGLAAFGLFDPTAALGQDGGVSADVDTIIRSGQTPGTPRDFIPMDGTQPAINADLGELPARVNAPPAPLPLTPGLPVVGEIKAKPDGSGDWVATQAPVSTKRALASPKNFTRSPSGTILGQVRQRMADARSWARKKIFGEERSTSWKAHTDPEAITMAPETNTGYTIWTPERLEELGEDRVEAMLSSLGQAGRMSGTQPAILFESNWPVTLVNTHRETGDAVALKVLEKVAAFIDQAHSHGVLVHAMYSGTEGLSDPDIASAHAEIAAQQGFDGHVFVTDVEPWALSENHPEGHWARAKARLSKAVAEGDAAGASAARQELLQKAMDWMSVHTEIIKRVMPETHAHDDTLGQPPELHAFVHPAYVPFLKMGMLWDQIHLAVKQQGGDVQAAWAVFDQATFKKDWTLEQLRTALSEAGFKLVDDDFEVELPERMKLIVMAYNYENQNEAAAVEVLMQMAYADGFGGEMGLAINMEPENNQISLADRPDAGAVTNAIVDRLRNSGNPNGFDGKTVYVNVASEWGMVDLARDGKLSPARQLTPNRLRPVQEYVHEGTRRSFGLPGRRVDTQHRLPIEENFREFVERQAVASLWGLGGGIVGVGPWYAVSENLYTWLVRDQKVVHPDSVPAGPELGSIERMVSLGLGALTSGEARVDNIHLVLVRIDDAGKRHEMRVEYIHGSNSPIISDHVWDEAYLEVDVSRADTDGDPSLWNELTIDMTAKVENRYSAPGQSPREEWEHVNIHAGEETARLTINLPQLINGQNAITLLTHNNQGRIVDWSGPGQNALYLTIYAPHVVNNTATKKLDRWQSDLAQVRSDLNVPADQLLTSDQLIRAGRRDLLSGQRTLAIDQLQVKTGGQADVIARHTISGELDLTASMETLRRLKQKGVTQVAIRVDGLERALRPALLSTDFGYDFSDKLPPEVQQLKDFVTLVHQVGLKASLVLDADQVVAHAQDVQASDIEKEKVKVRDRDVVISNFLKIVIVANEKQFWKLDNLAFESSQANRSALEKAFDQARVQTEQTRGDLERISREGLDVGMIWLGPQGAGQTSKWSLYANAVDIAQPVPVVMTQTQQILDERQNFFPREHRFATAIVLVGATLDETADWLDGLDTVGSSATVRDAFLNRLRVPSIHTMHAMGYSPEVIREVLAKAPKVTQAELTEALALRDKTKDAEPWAEAMVRAKAQELKGSSELAQVDRYGTPYDLAALNIYGINLTPVVLTEAQRAEVVPLVPKIVQGKDGAAILGVNVHNPSHPDRTVAPAVYDVWVHVDFPGWHADRPAIHKAMTMVLKPGETAPAWVRIDGIPEEVSSSVRIRVVPRGAEVYYPGQIGTRLEEEQTLELSGFIIDGSGELANSKEQTKSTLQELDDFNTFFKNWRVAHNVFPDVEDPEAIVDDAEYQRYRDLEQSVWNRYFYAGYDDADGNPVLRLTVDPKTGAVQSLTNAKQSAKSLMDKARDRIDNWKRENMSRLEQETPKWGVSLLTSIYTVAAWFAAIVLPFIYFVAMMRGWRRANHHRQWMRRNAQEHQLLFLNRQGMNAQGHTTRAVSTSIEDAIFTTGAGGATFQSRPAMADPGQRHPAEAMRAYDMHAVIVMDRDMERNSQNVSRSPLDPMRERSELEDRNLTWAERWQASRAYVEQNAGRIGFLNLLALGAAVVLTGSFVSPAVIVGAIASVGIWVGMAFSPEVRTGMGLLLSVPAMIVGSGLLNNPIVVALMGIPAVLLAINLVIPALGVGAVSLIAWQVAAVWTGVAVLIVVPNTTLADVGRAGVALAIAVSGIAVVLSLIGGALATIPTVPAWLLALLTIVVTNRLMTAWLGADLPVQTMARGLWDNAMFFAKVALVIGAAYLFFYVVPVALWGGFSAFGISFGGLSALFSSAGSSLSWLATGLSGSVTLPFGLGTFSLASLTVGQLIVGAIIVMSLVVQVSLFFNHLVLQFQRAVQDATSEDPNGGTTFSTLGFVNSILGRYFEGIGLNSSLANLTHLTVAALGLAVIIATAPLWIPMLIMYGLSWAARTYIPEQVQTWAGYVARGTVLVSAVGLLFVAPISVPTLLGAAALVTLGLRGATSSFVGAGMVVGAVALLLVNPVTTGTAVVAMALFAGGSWTSLFSDMTATRDWYSVLTSGTSMAVMYAIAAALWGAVPAATGIAFLGVMVLLVQGVSLGMLLTREAGNRVTQLIEGGADIQRTSPEERVPRDFDPGDPQQNAAYTQAIQDAQADTDSQTRLGILTFNNNTGFTRTQHRLVNWHYWRIRAVEQAQATQDYVGLTRNDRQRLINMYFTESMKQHMDVVIGEDAGTSMRSLLSGLWAGNLGEVVRHLRNNDNLVVVMPALLLSQAWSWGNAHNNGQTRLDRQPWLLVWEFMRMAIASFSVPLGFGASMTNRTARAIFTKNANMSNTLRVRGDAGLDGYVNPEDFVLRIMGRWIVGHVHVMMRAYLGRRISRRAMDLLMPQRWEHKSGDQGNTGTVRARMDLLDEQAEAAYNAGNWQEARELWGAASYASLTGEANLFFDVGERLSPTHMEEEVWNAEPDEDGLDDNSYFGEAFNLGRLSGTAAQRYSNPGGGLNGLHIYFQTKVEWSETAIGPDGTPGDWVVSQNPGKFVIRYPRAGHPKSVLANGSLEYFQGRTTPVAAIGLEEMVGGVAAPAPSAANATHRLTVQTVGEEHRLFPAIEAARETIEVRHDRYAGERSESGRAAATQMSEQRHERLLGHALGSAEDRVETARSDVGFDAYENASGQGYLFKLNLFRWIRDAFEHGQISPWRFIMQKIFGNTLRTFFEGQQFEAVAAVVRSVLAAGLVYWIVTGGKALAVGTVLGVTAPVSIPVVAIGAVVGALAYLFSGDARTAAVVGIVATVVSYVLAGGFFIAAGTVIGFTMPVTIPTVLLAIFMGTTIVHPWWGMMLATGFTAYMVSSSALVGAFVVMGVVVGSIFWGRLTTLSFIGLGVQDTLMQGMKGRYDHQLLDGAMNRFFRWTRMAARPDAAGYNGALERGWQLIGVGAAGQPDQALLDLTEAYARALHPESNVPGIGVVQQSDPALWNLVRNYIPRAPRNKVGLRRAIESEIRSRIAAKIRATRAGDQSRAWRDFREALTRNTQLYLMAVGNQVGGIMYNRSHDPDVFRAGDVNRQFAIEGQGPMETLMAALGVGVSVDRSWARISTGAYHGGVRIPPLMYSDNGGNVKAQLDAASAQGLVIEAVDGNQVWVRFDNKYPPDEEKKKKFIEGYKKRVGGVMGVPPAGVTLVRSHELNDANIPATAIRRIPPLQAYIATGMGQTVNQFAIEHTHLQPDLDTVVEDMRDESRALAEGIPADLTVAQVNAYLGQREQRLGLAAGTFVRLHESDQRWLSRSINGISILGFSMGGLRNRVSRDGQIQIQASFHWPRWMETVGQGVATLFQRTRSVLMAVTIVGGFVNPLLWIATGAIFLLGMPAAQSAIMYLLNYLHPLKLWRDLQVYGLNPWNMIRASHTYSNDVVLLSVLYGVNNRHVQRNIGWPRFLGGTGMSLPRWLGGPGINQGRIVNVRWSVFDGMFDSAQWKVAVGTYLFPGTSIARKEIGTKGVDPLNKARPLPFVSALRLLEEPPWTAPASGFNRLPSDMHELGEAFAEDTLFGLNNLHEPSKNPTLNAFNVHWSAYLFGQQELRKRDEATRRAVQLFKGMGMAQGIEHMLDHPLVAHGQANQGYLPDMMEGALAVEAFRKDEVAAAGARGAGTWAYGYTGFTASNLAGVRVGPFAPGEVRAYWEYQYYNALGDEGVPFMETLRTIQQEHNPTLNASYDEADLLRGYLVDPFAVLARVRGEALLAAAGGPNAPPQPVAPQPAQPAAPQPAQPAAPQPAQPAAPQPAQPAAPQPAQPAAPAQQLIADGSGTTSVVHRLVDIPGNPATDALPQLPALATATSANADITLTTDDSGTTLAVPVLAVNDAPNSDIVIQAGAGVGSDASSPASLGVLSVGTGAALQTVQQISSAADALALARHTEEAATANGDATTAADAAIQQLAVEDLLGGLETGDGSDTGLEEAIAVDDAVLSLPAVERWMGTLDVTSAEVAATATATVAPETPVAVTTSLPNVVTTVTTALSDTTLTDTQRVTTFTQVVEQPAAVTQLAPAQVRDMSTWLRDAAVNPDVDVALAAQQARMALPKQLLPSTLAQVQAVSGVWTPPEGPAPLVFLFADPSNIAYAPLVAQAGVPVGVIVENATQARLMEDLFAETSTPHFIVSLDDEDVLYDRARAVLLIEAHFARQNVVGQVALQAVPVNATVEEMQNFLFGYGVSFDATITREVQVVDRYLWSQA